MRMKKKPWGDVLLSENKDLVMLPEDLDKDVFINFINHDQLVLEIGSGKGDFVISMAKKYPDIHFLAIEMQSMALAYAVRKMQDEEISNILFINADATYLFEKFNEKKFKTIFLNHSDPWPKARHHKRRLTYPTMLEKYSKILQKDGKLIFKTDNEILFKDSVEYIDFSPFVIEEITYDYDGSDDYDATTEYETRFRNIGTPIKRFKAKLKGE